MTSILEWEEQTRRKARANNKNNHEKKNHNENLISRKDTKNNT